jgi:hypothetical protein
MEEPTVYHDTPVPSDYQTAVVAEPGERALHLPSSLVSSQFSAIGVRRLPAVVAPIRHDQLDATLQQPRPQRVAVVALVRDDPLRIFPRAASASARYGDPFDRRLQQLHFRRTGRVQVVPQRNSFAVDHHHPLRALAAFGLADAEPPFFAGAKLPSIKASCQSSAPFSSSMDKNLRQTSSQTPCSSQSLSRRQQVEALGYRSGRSCHRAPVRSTQRIPSSTSRFSIGGRPPLALRLALGSNGSSSFHWSFIIKPVYLAIEHLPIA